MKSIVVLCLVAAVAAAAPPAGSGREAQIVKAVYENQGEGFVYEYAQDDGTNFQAKGDFHPGTGKDGEGGAVVIRGSYEWVGPDAVTYTVNYVADENGYHPQLAQGPNGAIPEEVVKAFSGPK